MPELIKSESKIPLWTFAPWTTSNFLPMRTVSCFKKHVLLIPRNSSWHCFQADTVVWLGRSVSLNNPIQLVLFSPASTYPMPTSVCINTILVFRWVAVPWRWCLVAFVCLDIGDEEWRAGQHWHRWGWCFQAIKIFVECFGDRLLILFMPTARVLQ